MYQVKAKKALGQHFLTDERIAFGTVEALTETFTSKSGNKVLEVGPGMGVLTKYMVKDESIDLRVVEIDSESVEYLLVNYPGIDKRIYQGDFLRMDFNALFDGEFSVIGNFPYNISSQIFFKILDNKERIPVAVGMVQKEVAERLASPPGKKAYGILSVLLQAWYDIEYLFTVEPGVFNPPPKVRSAVIRIRRNSRTELGCDADTFKKVVKTAFNQRRKTIRNSLKPLMAEYDIAPTALLDLRPEQLSVDQFCELTLCLTKKS